MRRAQLNGGGGKLEMGSWTEGRVLCERLSHGQLSRIG